MKGSGESAPEPWKKSNSWINRFVAGAWIRFVAAGIVFENGDGGLLAQLDRETIVRFRKIVRRSRVH